MILCTFDIRVQLKSVKKVDKQIELSFTQL